MRGVQIDSARDPLELHRADLGEGRPGVARRLDDLLGDEDLAGSRVLGWDLAKNGPMRPPEPNLNGSQRESLSETHHGGLTLITTLPLARPSSTWRSASTIWLNG
jgi:hypothetical protein